MNLELVKVHDFIQQHGGNYDALSSSEKEAIDWMRFEERIRQEMKLNTGEVAKIRGLFINEVEAQARLSQALSLILPSAALTYLASDVARTGIESERNFRRAIFRYRRQYAEYLDESIEKTGDYSKLWRIDKNEVPPFGYRELSFSQAIATHLPHFMVLVLYPILFFLGAQLAFIRSQL